MILLDSLYINNSGGKVLLDLLINELHSKQCDVFYLLDKRCESSYQFLPPEKTLYLIPTLRNRHAFYKRNGKQFSKVLCFGNIPPSIRLKCTVYTYFHNVLLLEQPSKYPFLQKLQKKIKGVVISLLKNNTDYFIVQSENVKRLIIEKLHFKDSKCLIIPFYRKGTQQSISSKKTRESAFVYVSNANPHKNHNALLKAWELLYKKGVDVPLHLTVTSDYPQTVSLINDLRKRGLNITNHGIVNVFDLYSKCKFSIYPSLAESFGLSLIEAIEAGCEVVAADLPYTNAIIEPLGKFDPNNVESIAESVIKALNQENELMVSKAKISNEINKLTSILAS